MNIAEKLTAIAENEQKVYDAGKTKGIEEGKQAQYDLFWNIVQQNGNRTDYEKAFCGWREAEAIFKPKYDIKPVGRINEMFRGFRTYSNFPAVCEITGITMDFSKVTEFTNWVYNTAIWRLGVIDCSSTTIATYIFNNASSLTTIDKWIVHEGITSYSNMVANASLLQNITIEGVIAGTGFDVAAHTKLTHDSLFGKEVTAEKAATLPSTNVVELNGKYYYGGIIIALKDYSGTSTTKTVTLGTTNLAKLTDAEKAIATERGWTLA